MSTAAGNMTDEQIGRYLRLAHHPTAHEPAACEGGRLAVSCWGLVRLVLMQCGYVASVPVDFLEAMYADPPIARILPAKVARRAGDIVVFHKADWPHQHAGVCVDAFRFLHAASERPESAGGVGGVGGVRLTRMDAYLHAGMGVSVQTWRPIVKATKTVRGGAGAGDGSAQGEQEEGAGA